MPPGARFRSVICLIPPDGDGCYQGGRVRLDAVRTTVAGVLLAAGEGSRLGQPKALVKLNGQTLAERGVALLRAGGADPVARLIAAYRDGASVAVAAYDGRPRNPVLLAREHWPEVITTATGDQGARTFLRTRPELVTLVECGDT